MRSGHHGSSRRCSADPDAPRRAPGAARIRATGAGRSSASPACRCRGWQAARCPLRRVRRPRFARCAPAGGKAHAITERELGFVTTGRFRRPQHRSPAQSSTSANKMRPGFSVCALRNNPHTAAWPRSVTPSDELDRDRPAGEHHQSRVRHGYRSTANSVPGPAHASAFGACPRDGATVRNCCRAAQYGDDRWRCLPRRRCGGASATQSSPYSASSAAVLIRNGWVKLRAGQANRYGRSNLPGCPSE